MREGVRGQTEVVSEIRSRYFAMLELRQQTQALYGIIGSH